MNANKHPSPATTRHDFQRPVLSVLVATLCLLTGGLQARENVPPAPATLTPTHRGLTPAYLAGPWCFTHVQFPNERSDENIQYRFDPDGTFATQNTPRSKLQPGFRYSYKPDGRVKLATYAGFPKVRSVNPDAFVLFSNGEMHFRRGMCK